MRNDGRRSRGSHRCEITSLEYAIHKEKGRGYRCRPHAHDAGELICVDYGRVVLRTPETRVVLGTGDCLIIPPRTMHSFTGERGAPFDFLNVVYRGRVPHALSGEVIHLSGDERRLLAALKHEGERGLAHHVEIMRCQLEMLFLLLDRAGRGAAGAEPIVPENRALYRSRVAERAVTHLRAHYARPLDVRAVARQAGVSPSHLRYLMRHETGMSLRQHLRQIRIEAAKRLLRESSDNVDAICYRVGYGSVPHFCNAFKREVKMTPGEYGRSLG